MSDAQPAAVHEWADLWEKYMLENRALRAEIQAAKADLDALASIVGQAIVASSLAPGESVANPPQHAIFTAVERLRARAEAAAAALKQAQDDGRLLLSCLSGTTVGRLFEAGLTWDEGEQIAALWQGINGDDQSRPPLAELAAVRRLLALGPPTVYPFGPLPVGQTSKATDKAQAADKAADKAELEQVRADRRRLLAELYSADLADEGYFFAWAGCLVSAGMTEAEMAAMRKLTTTKDPKEMLAIVRRVLSTQPTQPGVHNESEVE